MKRIINSIVMMTFFYVGYAQTAESLKNEVNANPNNAELQTKYGKALYNEKRYQEAINQFKAKDTKFGSTSLDLFYWGRANFSAKNYGDAVAIFTRFLDKNPTSTDGFLWKAKSLSMQDPELKKGDAYPFYQKFIQTNPTDNQKGLIEAYQYSGLYNLYLKQDKETAKSFLLKASTLAPDDVDIKTLLTQINTTQQTQTAKASVSAEEQKCYDFINMCVQECNGELVFQRNFHQLDAKFTPQGFFAETDFPDTDHHTQYEKKDIKWGHLKNTNVQELNFRYSIICIQFVKNFELKSRSGIKNMYSGQGTMWNGNGHSKDVCFGIIVKKERVKECVDMIYQLFNLAKSKEPVQSLQLTKKEEWTGSGYLETYYIDQNGNLQGKYELLDDKGKIYTSGSYKDNAKVGYWSEGGLYRGMYENDHQVGKWNNSGGSITTFDRDGNADVGGRRKSVDFCLCEIY